MRLSSIPFELLLSVAVVVVFASGVLLWQNVFRSSQALSRRHVVMIGVLWTAFCTVEYWILGPLSALGWPDEYHSAIPWMYYLAHHHMGGSYAHGFAGGLDAIVGTASGTQFLSIERIAFEVLPLWATVLFMKGGAIAIAYSGGYQLARIASGISRGKAVVVGLLMSGGHVYNFGWVMGGIGWAIPLLPWVFIALCLRTHRNHYYLVVLLAALAYSSGVTSIVHTAPPLALAVLLSCALSPPARPLRFVIGGILFSAVALLNWLDVLLATVLVATESARATSAPAVQSLWETFRANYDVIALSVGVVSLVILTAMRDRYFWRAAATLIVAATLGSVLSGVDWSSSMRVLAAYRWSLLSDDYILPALLVLGRALGSLNWQPRREAPIRIPPVSALYFACIAVACASYFKGLTVVNLRGYGGQGVITQPAVSLDCATEVAGRYRVVTLPGLISPSTAASHGFHTLDGVASNFTIRSNRYFGLAVTIPPDHQQNVQYHWIRIREGAPALAQAASLDALRIANVRYIFSDRPLTDDGLTVASNRCLDAWARNVTSRFRFGGWGPSLLPQAHVYELAGTWPRAFIPSEVRTSLSSYENPAFYEELKSLAQTPAALIAHDDGHLVGDAGFAQTHLILEDYHLVPDGFDLTIAAQKAAGSTRGLVVVNAPFSQFWHASIRGGALKIIPVNGIHTGIVWTGQSGVLELRYRRPSTFDFLTRATD